MLTRLVGGEEVEEDLLPEGLHNCHVVQRVLGHKQQLVNVNLLFLLLVLQLLLKEFLLLEELDLSLDVRVQHTLHVKPVLTEVTHESQQFLLGVDLGAVYALRLQKHLQALGVQLRDVKTVLLLHEELVQLLLIVTVHNIKLSGRLLPSHLLLHPRLLRLRVLHLQLLSVRILLLSVRSVQGLHLPSLSYQLAK